MITYHIRHEILLHSLGPGGCGSNFKNVIFKKHDENSSLSIRYDIAFG